MAKSKFLDVIDSFSDQAANRQISLFYHYEPWDGPDEKELAAHPEKWRNEKCIPPKHTPGGAPFQKSCALSTKRICGQLGANRIGKSIGLGVISVIMITGELPYSLRVDAGIDTGIKRVLPSQMRKFGRENIQRWGRRRKSDGAFLDYNQDAKEDGTWDCGNIMGVGKFPDIKICKDDGQQLWLGCWGDIRDKLWIPLMRLLIPEQCLDSSRGTNGYTANDSVFHLSHNRQIRTLSYDQGYKRAEGEMAWAVILDEEPTDRRFYTGVLGHCKWLLMSWTPIHGMSWSYDDIYEPAVMGRRPDTEIFHATRYDCPYTDDKDLAILEKELKTYEYESKVLGTYSRQEGRPYYDYDITKEWIRNFRTTAMLCEIQPNRHIDNPRELQKVGAKLVKSNEAGPLAWEIYEERIDGAAYILTADCAEGSDDPEQAQDFNGAHVWRMPIETKGEQEPVHVASMRTTVPLESFAWLCAYAATYYNNCLLAPETKGEHGASFFVEIRDYPHWFVMPLVNDKTGRSSDKIGFNTNAKTRNVALNKVRKWVNSHPDDPKIRHLRTIIEISEAIWLKNRCDHPKNGTSDCLIPFAIMLYAYEECRNQIRNNREIKGKVRDLHIPRILGLTIGKEYAILNSGSGNRVLGRKYRSLI